MSPKQDESEKGSESMLSTSSELIPSSFKKGYQSPGIQILCPRNQAFRRTKSLGRSLDT